jgi:hypothetical protein
MTPQPGQSSFPQDAPDPPLSRHAAEVEREPEDEALSRARRSRPQPGPVGSPADDLRGVIEGWVSRHPCAAVSAFFGAGFLFGLCTARSQYR